MRDTDIYSTRCYDYRAETIMFYGANQSMALRCMQLTHFVCTIGFDHNILLVPNLLNAAVKFILPHPCPLWTHIQNFSNPQLSIRLMCILQVNLGY